MSLRAIGISLTLAVISCFWCQPGLAVGPSLISSDKAKQDPTLPQNFRVSELREGPERFQVSLVYEWDRAMKKGTGGFETKYVLNKACTYKFSGQDKKVGFPSGLTVMEGPGPKYRVEAVCACSGPGYTYIAPTVKANEGVTAVYIASPPGAPAPNNPSAFVAPCKRTK